MRRVLFAATMLATSWAMSFNVASRADEGDWTNYGRTTDEQRFSPLTQINADTVGKLGLAWAIDLPPQALGMQGTPLEVGGVLYFTTGRSEVYAVDAVTGKELWQYRPELAKENPRRLRLFPGVNRGAAYWNGHIIYCAVDGTLISLDAKTGKVAWSANTISEKNERKASTGAPRLMGDRVIIGNSGADWGTRGYVTAYDAATGKQLWRFYTVPGDPKKGFENDAMAKAAKTWNGEWWKWGGGGTVWNAITYDAEKDWVYIGAGNGSNYNANQRSPGGGDNLYLASIVALDAKTGRYVWHYQMNPAESWDYKSTADIVLADVAIDGKKQRVVMQANMNGFFYVLDRDTGKLLSAEKFGKATWAERIDLKTGRPVEAPNLRYQNGAVTIWPGAWGVHDWQAMSFSPKTGLAYIPTQKMPATYNATPQDAKDAAAQDVNAPRMLLALGVTMFPTKVEADDATGGLSAWDPGTQKARWTVKYASPWNGGTLVTGGNLVFQGTGDGWLYAYDATTGKELWKQQTGQGIIAPPISFAVGKTQYVSVLAGYAPPAGGGVPGEPGWRFGRQPPRVLTYKLDGATALPATLPPHQPVQIIDDPKQGIDVAAAQRGENLWNRTCVICHGFQVKPEGIIAPDLRESPAAHDLDTFRAILKDGASLSNGMPQFDDFSDRDISDLQTYIRKASRDALNAGKPSN